MKPSENNSRPRNQFVAKAFALLVSFGILSLLIWLNMRLYGTPFVFVRQLYACGAALFVGALFVYSATAARRWKYSLIGSVGTAVIAAAAWFLVPHRDGGNLVQMHYNASLRLAELRSLPHGQIEQFLTNREGRNRRTHLLPRFGRLIRAEEEQWLSKTLSTINDQAASCLNKSNPLESWDILKGPLWNLPAPDSRQHEFHNEWLRAKKLRLKAAKMMTLERLEHEEFQGAHKIAWQLHNDANLDRFRGTPVDVATEQFIDSVEFLNSLNELSLSQSGR